MLELYIICQDFSLKPLSSLSMYTLAEFSELMEPEVTTDVRVLYVNKFVRTLLMNQIATASITESGLKCHMRR